LCHSCCQKHMLFRPLITAARHGRQGRGGLRRAEAQRAAATPAGG
jgi:hypothetical protein